MQPPFRDKPWYIAIFTSGRWVTTYPYINLPDNTDPAKYPWIVAHETVHLGQQKAMGFYKWLWKYYTSRAFRLDQEAEGAVAESRYLAAHGYDGNVCLQNYAEEFASVSYLWAAKSEEAAMAVLQEKLKAGV